MQRVEIVTHCWQYGALLRYQIESLERNYWRHGRQVQLTVYCAAPELDPATHALLAHYHGRPLHVRQQPLERLFVRAIGRHDAVQHTQADWLWFADADYVFGPKCLYEIKGDGPLYFAGTVYTHKSHAVGDQYLLAPCQDGQPLLDPQDFYARRQGKAIGGNQIASARAARAVGYCPSPRWQQPAPGATHFLDTRSDRAFRVSLGTSGVPLPLSDVYRLRHSRAGRFGQTLDLFLPPSPVSHVG